MCRGTARGQIVIMTARVLGMGLTWPTLEALVSEGETPAGLQRMLGIYNVVWGGTGALAYFTGGAVLEKFGLKSLFYVPLAIQLAQLGFAFWLERWAVRQASCLSPGGLQTARSVWSAWRVLPLLGSEGDTRAGASSPHSKRFAPFSAAAPVTGGSPTPPPLNPRPIS